MVEGLQKRMIESRLLRLMPHIQKCCSFYAPGCLSMANCQLNIFAQPTHPPLAFQQMAVARMP
jgi:hypothetical protein